MEPASGSRRGFLKALALTPLVLARRDGQEALGPASSSLAKTQAEDIHFAAIVIDHACPLVEPAMGDDYLKLLQAGGITVAMATVASNHNFREALDEILKWYDRLEREQDRLLHVRTVDDIYRAKKEAKIGIGFHFQNSRPVEHDLRLLGVFQRLGVRTIQLTYNEKNLAGDGCTERTDAGLSKFGVRMVEEMNRLGILVDLSHVGYRTTMDALELTKAPAIFSHSNAWSVYPSKRNIKDDQIEALARTGGVIGMNAFPGFVKKTNPTLDDLLDHVDYIAKLVGTDHIGIGFDYSQSNPEDYKKWGYDTDTYPMPPWVYPAGIDDPSKTPSFTKGLLARGYSEEEVAKILGGNFIRVFKAVWKA